MGGQIAAGDGGTAVGDHANPSGLLRALAVTSEKRWPTLPEVPSIAESGYPATAT